MGRIAGKWPVIRMPVLPILAMLLLTACAAEAPPAARAVAASAPGDANVCLDADRVTGWTVVDDRTIEVTVAARHRYLVELGVAADVVGLRGTSQIGIVPDISGDLCSLGGRIIADGRRIPVRGIRQLPPRGAETAATPT